MADFDLAIIGGGINGVGIARDAAGRGLKVALFEQNDLASGTSSASSKLIHGGLRYLEHGALRLVRAALSEREVLLRIAPHLIRPLRFVLPLDAASRSPIVLRLGLFIYDLIGHRADFARHASARSRHRRSRPAAQAALPPWLTNIPIALPTMRVSSCVNARRRRRTRRGNPHPHTLRARRARRCLAAHSQCARRARRRDRAGAGQRRRRLGRDGCRDRAATGAAAAAAARQGQPHRGAASLRSRPRLHFAGGRRPSRVRHSVSARLHADRHDRSEFCRRSSGGRADRRRRSTISAASSTNISAPRSAPPTWCGLMRACARSTTTARASRRTSAATTRSSSTKRFGEAPLLTVYGGKLTTYRRLAEDALARLCAFLSALAAVDREQPVAGRRFRL